MRIEELERCIDLELVKTERRRLEIFIGIMGSGFVLLLINIFFFSNALMETLRNPESIWFGMYITLGFILLLFISRRIVGKIAASEKPLPMTYKAYSILMESIVPSIWLFLIMKWEQNALFLDSPIVFGFIPIIIVSALHLSFWLSFFHGLLIAAIYGGLSYWGLSFFDENIFLPP